MNLWRISRHEDLQGLGGERSNGRWHTAARSKRIVYLSEHPAVALLEVLANLKGTPQLFPATYRLMQVAVPDRAVASIESVGALAEGWRDDLGYTRKLGDAWLARSSSALLQVPSAPSPESLNYLLNPLHPDSSGFEVVMARWMGFDKRLFHLPR